VFAALADAKGEHTAHHSERTADLCDRLAEALRLPVEVGSVFDRLPVKGTVYGPEDLGRVGPNLAVATGLALGGLE
jgi:hypothetical protein